MTSALAKAIALPRAIKVRKEHHALAALQRADTGSLGREGRDYRAVCPERRGGRIFPGVAYIDQTTNRSFREVGRSVRPVRSVASPMRESDGRSWALPPVSEPAALLRRAQ